MLMSYFGGSPQIIKPDYRFGIRSIIRELFLIEAHAVAHTADAMLRLLTLETQFSSLLDPSKAPDILRRKMDRGKWLTKLRQMDLYAKEPFTLTAESMVRLYSALEKSGIIKDEIEDDTPEPEPPDDDE